MELGALNTCHLHIGCHGSLQTRGTGIFILTLYLSSSKIDWSSIDMWSSEFSFFNSILCAKICHLWHAFTGLLSHKPPSLYSNDSIHAKFCIISFVIANLVNTPCWNHGLPVIHPTNWLSTPILKYSRRNISFHFISFSPPDVSTLWVVFVSYRRMWSRSYVATLSLTNKPASGAARSGEEWSGA